MPKIVDHDAYRMELLEQATPLFLQAGYAGLTTRQLACQLGISTGKLYHYFTSKESLFEALVQHWTEQESNEVRDSFARIQDRQERIRSIAHCLTDSREKFETQIHLMLQYARVQEQKGVDTRPFWDKISSIWEEMTKELLDLKSEFACSLVSQVIDGLFMQWLQGCQNKDIFWFFDRLAHWLPLIDEAESKSSTTPSKS